MLTIVNSMCVYLATHVKLYVHAISPPQTFGPCYIAFGILRSLDSSMCIHASELFMLLFLVIFILFYHKLC